MIEKKDLLEKMLNEEFARLAKEEEDTIQKEDISMPEEAEKDIYAGIQEKVHEFERERQNEYLYAQLSEEDLKALELGRKIMEREAREEREGKIIRKKKRIRMYVGLAAALVLAMGVGVTSMGGPERVIRMMKRMVGDREVVQYDSNENNLTKVEESEENAYQEIADKYGIEPVRIVTQLEGFKFEDFQFDETLQTAELCYNYKNEKVVYFINASYRDASWGVDVEDSIIDRYSKEVKGCSISVKEYNIDKINIPQYSANFKYKGIEYFIIGMMSKEEFEGILNNLFFPR